MEILPTTLIAFFPPAKNLRSYYFSQQCCILSYNTLKQ